MSMVTKIRDTIKEQVRQIRGGGVFILWQKLITIPMIVLALPFALLVRLLRPVLLIRFWPLNGRRIGHLSAETEIYLCERDAGINGRARAIDIFYYLPPICNIQLKKMLDRALFILPWAKFIDKANRIFPGYQKHVVPFRKVDRARDINCVLAGTQPHLSFTQEEEHMGRQKMLELGISEGAPFVCFYARDAAYLKAVMPMYEWSYQDFRDSDISNYVPAAEELTRRGYFALRMGFIVKKAIKTGNPRIVDYATNGRTDFMDIFLGAKCRFFIGASAGLSGIPMIFRRPVAWVNFIPLEYVQSWGPEDLFIPKKIWLRRERRFMTFSEILKSGVGQYQYTREYDLLGIEPIENTPEEIIALAREMDDRLKGQWKTTKEDEELQKRFWSLFKSGPLHGKFLARIGAEFLRQNANLLD